MTSTTTGQTSLATATDSDDTESYLTTSLVSVLQALANLFESATGHDHTGAGKGKPIGPGGLTGLLATASNVLGADVALNNTGTYFDGPSMAQGTVGTWLVIGTVTLTDTAAATFRAKLWDGTTVIASAVSTMSTAGGAMSITLAGFLAAPVANIRISVEDISSVNGAIKFNLSTGGKDSSVFGVRIA